MGRRWSCTVSSLGGNCVVFDLAYMYWFGYLWIYGRYTQIRVSCFGYPRSPGREKQSFFFVIDYIYTYRPLVAIQSRWAPLSALHSYPGHYWLSRHNRRLSISSSTCPLYYRLS